MKYHILIHVLVAAALAADNVLSSLPLPIAPAPSGTPIPAPAYMQDNQGNPHGAAPDKGYLTGPVFQPLPAAVEQVLHGNGLVPVPPASSLYNVTTFPPWLQNLSSGIPGIGASVQSRDVALPPPNYFWLQNITHGQMPLAGPYYAFFRNVKDFGAKGDGVHDDTAAINLAIAAGNRCGANCGSSSTKGAMIYFPNGTYAISTPIVQYYYTQFVGDYNQRPIIKGLSNFSGIALIDTDFYIPGGGGDEWYINQDQFYRQIRNFILDLTSMKAATNSAGQSYVPTGIHYQVAQATSLQNIDFLMTHGGDEVGILMENGSGGFASDLSFFGGNIGWRAGSQQFTARNIHFTGCITAIQMIWDWGFTWQNVQITSCLIAFDCTSYGGNKLRSGTYQGTGSLAILDSTFNSVGTGVNLKGDSAAPELVLDNLLVQKTNAIVAVAGGTTILQGTSGALTVQSWGLGRRYVSEFDTGSVVAGGNLLPAPVKPPSLLASNGKWFTQSKPQYQSLYATDFVIATANGISNGGTGDQSSAINKMLAANVGKPIFFPAGIYVVQSTVFVPVGSIIIGEGWSQIMASGAYFSNEASPQVMVRVGNPGDSGVIQISDMLFTVRGATAGAILVEWNVHESTQGSAAMWDSHFRVGGANGTNLSLENCPKFPQGTSINNCKAASLLLHITPSASGYFENVWAWVADHDLDSPLNAGEQDDANGVPQATNVQVSVFSGRGILVESQGPTWFYGTAAEHNVMYQYQLLNAKNIFLGHMQTETPYYQPYYAAPAPFGYSVGKFPSDPVFGSCKAGVVCADALGLRILDSSNVFIYSAGLYSFFQSYYTGVCTVNENCQESILETSFSHSIWLYNLFTKGVVEVITPDGLIPTVFQNTTNQLGFTSEINAWLALALSGADQGSGTPPTLPPTKVTTITTDGVTLTLTLTEVTSSSSGSPPQKTTVTDGSITLTLTLPYTSVPAPSAAITKTTVTTNGHTYTFTLTDATQSLGGSPAQVTTIKTAGQTFTFTLPNAPPGTPVVITTTDGSGHQTVFTETLYPTTATNSKGQTIVGTITRGPTSPTPSLGGLHSYSTFPPGVSWSYTSVATNTHDSNGHPILPPWPLCWFCPPGSDGIVLFNFPDGGIFPAGGPPAGLPTPFPPMTIEPDGTPDFPRDPETTTGSTCSGKTATDITYYVSYGVNTAGSTTATATYSTASARVTGCTVTGHTATSSTVSTCSSGCCNGWTYSSAPYTEDALLKRSVTLLLANRESSSKRNFLITRSYLTYLEQQAPRASLMLQLFMVMPKLVIAGNSPILVVVPSPQLSLCPIFCDNQPTTTVPGGACPVPHYTQVPDWVGQTVTAGGLPYTTIKPVPGQPYFSSDHVYEVQTLVKFISFMIQSNAIACSDFQSFFEMKILQNVFNYLASKTNPDMAALDSGLNGKKGALYNQPIVLLGKKQPLAKGLQAIYDFGMAVAVVNDPAFVERFRRTNQRLYEAFAGVDEEISLNCGSGLKPIWAASYSNWIQNYLHTQGTSASNAAVTLYNKLAGVAGINLQAAQATYPAAKFLFNSAAMGVLVAGATQPVKRQACTTSIPPTTTTTPPPPPPVTSAQPNTIIMFSDPNCQVSVTALGKGCAETSADVYSYKVGNTDDCECYEGGISCQFQSFVISSSGCDGKNVVGGGCGGPGALDPTHCYQTTGPGRWSFQRTNYSPDSRTNGTAKHDYNALL